MFFIQIHWPLTSCSANITNPRTNWWTGSCLRSCVGFARVIRFVILCTRKNIKNYFCFFLQYWTDDGPDEKWLIFDGSIDNGWCENMSHAMDDNRVLILANGKRIPIPRQVYQTIFSHYITNNLAPEAFRYLI